MRKFLITMMCIIMVVCFIPTVAMAGTGNVQTGYGTDTLPTGPNMSGDIINVNADNIQYTLDGAYGCIDGKTIVLSDGDYGKIELGRATKYAGSNTDYYIGGIAPENKKTCEEFVAIKNSGTWSPSAYYVRNMSNVTIKAAEGANVKVAGLIASSGHVYGNVYDYVLDKAYESGSAYYLSQNLQNITIEGITFTAKAEFSTSSSDTVIDGVTFKNCTFNIGRTASGYQALRYYNENNNGKVKNLTVDNCTFDTCFQGVYTQKINGVKVINSRFDTTGHNAIAVQSGSEAENHKSVVITGNTFANIGDRVIRFGNVGADTHITIKNNTATNSGDSSGQVMKAQSLATGVTYDICGNSWGEGKTVANSELADQSAVAEINGVQYTSLQATIAAATDGQTITLLDDVTTTTRILIDKNIKLSIDLNNHNISGVDCFTLWVKSGDVTLTGNGTVQVINANTIADDSYVIFAGYGANGTEAKLTIGKDVTVLSPKPYAIALYGPNQEEVLNVYGKVISEGSEAAISTNGTDYTKATINIYNGAEVSATDAAAIYVPSSKNVNIYGGTITGKDSAIGMKEGVLNISGGTLKATGDSVIPPEGYSNGINASGAAIQVESNDAYKLNSNTQGTVQINITDGTIESYNCYAIYEYIGKNGANNLATGSHLKSLAISGGTINGKLGSILTSEEVATADPKVVTATGGTFSSDPTAYVPANSRYYVSREGGKYVVRYSTPTTTLPPTTPTDNVTNSGSTAADNATTSADLSGSTSTSNGTTSATVDKTTADKIVDKAVENKSTEVVIDATANTTTAANSTTIAQVTIPTETLGAIAEKTEADVTIKTDVAEVKMDNAAAAAVSEQAEGDTVQIIAEKVKEDATEVHFELKVVCSDGKVISDFKGGNVAVTVALPKAMADKKVVCVYIDDNGHMSKVAGQKNADGTYTFNTGHFSSYAIMAEEEADAAIAAQKEAIKNIKIKLTSKQVKTKAGKKAVKITWTADAGDKVLDGVEVFRSTERYKGYGTEPFYTSTKRGNTGSYTNTKSLKKGTKYYYRVRGYILVNGEKVYTDYSTKAWRTVK